MIRSWFPAALAGVAAAAILALSGCGSEDGKSQRAGTAVGDDAKRRGGQTGTGGPTGTGSGGEAGGDTDGTGGEGNGTADSGGDGGVEGGVDGGGDGVDVNAGPAFYASTLEPLFRAACVGCHADPRMQVQIRGPLSIFAYDKMRALLVNGTGAQSNAMINKVSGLLSHGGGNRCAGGLTATPCKELVQWWNIELGNGGGGDDGGQLTGARGAVLQATALGRIYGWAANAADVNEYVVVTFYEGGPKGTGTKIGETTANVVGTDGGTPGNHAFTFDVPVALRDQTARQLYTYAVIDGAEEPLSTQAFSFTAYTFSDAGRNYYNANVRPGLANCQGCHTVSYEQQFYSMLSPSPAQGGTAGNNQLINKPATANGNTHGGGNRCGNVNSGVCAQIQAWWNIEFGN